MKSIQSKEGTRERQQRKRDTLTSKEDARASNFMWK